VAIRSSKAPTTEQGAYDDRQSLNLPAALPVSPTHALVSSGSNTFTVLQGGFGIVVCDGQTPVNLANLIITHNFFDGSLAVVKDISANNSALGFGFNTVNNVAFDTIQVGEAGADSVIGTDGLDWISGGDGADILKGGSNADVFVFAKQSTADTITDWGGRGDEIWLDDAASPASPL
jgi:Ca2+-binding RTX toxin-like protein